MKSLANSDALAVNCLPTCSSTSISCMLESACGCQFRRWMVTRGAAGCQPRASLGSHAGAVLPAPGQFCCHWVPAFLLCWELSEGAQPGTRIFKHKAKLGAVRELSELLPYDEHLAMFLVQFAGNMGGFWDSLHGSCCPAGLSGIDRSHCQNCTALISVPGQLLAQTDIWEALPVIIEPGVR